MATPVLSHGPTATPHFTDGATEAQRGEETCSLLHSKLGAGSEQGSGLQTVKLGTMNGPFFQSRWVPHLLLLSPAPTEHLVTEGLSLQGHHARNKGAVRARPLPVLLCRTPAHTMGMASQTLSFIAALGPALPTKTSVGD